MKSRILLLLFIVVSGLPSCQSEYGERLSIAMQLKREYKEVEATMHDSKDPVLKVHLNRIEKEIKFHATLSGNESLFLEQIWNN